MMKSKIHAEFDTALELGPLVEGQKTYPTWTTGMQYPLEFEHFSDDEVLIFFRITKSAVPRIIKRCFPRQITLTPRFFWVLGFLEGEGANKLGKSNYRRVTITNSNATDMRIVLDELESQKLLFRKAIPKGGAHIFVRNPRQEVQEYWREKLGLQQEQIQLFEKSNATSEYGICHIYISDVLLRRVTDIVQKHFSFLFLSDSFLPPSF